MNNESRIKHVSLSDKLIINDIRETYIQRAKVYFIKHNKLPLEAQFIKEGLGTKKYINKYFNTFDILLQNVNTAKEITHKESLLFTDMNILTDIMKDFNLFPIKSKDSCSYPIDRLIFCNILAIKYPELRAIGIFGTWTRYKNIKTPVANFLNYKNNIAVKSCLRPGAVDSIKGYKTYYDDYLFIKACFIGDKDYILLKELEEKRDILNIKIEKIKLKILKQ